MVSQVERRAATIHAIVEAAMRLFGDRGFHATTIDDVALEAGVAKGAVYHHFESKEEVFEQVVEQTQKALVATVAAAARKASREGKTPIQCMKLGTRAYLLAAIQPEARQIVLLDGPAVLGWEKWRDIDTRYFGATLSLPGTEQPTGATAGVAAGLPASVHVLLGAITEAAMVCARAKLHRAAVDEMMVALEAVFDGVFAPRV